jgi:hypothetical protein
MNPTDWIKVLVTYGPNAILVFLVFITEKKLRTAMRDGPPEEKNKFVWVYILNWGMIFGVVIFTVVAWSWLNLYSKPEIQGTMRNLATVETLSSSSAELYQHKNVKSHSVYDSSWRLVTDKKLGAGSKIRFTIQAPKPNSRDDDLYEYELEVQPDFYSEPVDILHRQGKFFLVRNGQEKELAGGVLSDDSTPTLSRIERSPEFFPVAYAQSQMAQQAFSPYDFTVGLESPDAIIRRRTRADLALQDQSVVLPWIDQVLSDPKSSYRLRVGVLVALNNMPNLPGEALRPATIAAIQGVLNDPDATLRNEALSLAKKYNLIPVTIYEHYNYSGKSQVFGPGKFRADKGQLGNLPNDSASSLRVADGFTVRLCENENDGQGGGICERKGPGNHQLKWGSESLADKVSFIEVSAAKKVDAVMKAGKK